MATRLLIDAAHPEETRVVVVNGTRLEEFDFESAARRQLKGNIYLAKVTRVEPSLQAAFVDYGGNRHGFLAFGDIHPDYYQIPYEDRQALLAERAAEDAERHHRDDDGGHDGGVTELHHDTPPPAPEVLEGAAPESLGDEHSAPMPEGEGSSAAYGDDQHNGDRNGDHGNADDDRHDHGNDHRHAEPETIGGDEATEFQPRRHSRRYKIQEVIKRRQVMLVQVVKEERGTKGAALTTYLSLAGRYCVLMPNTARGGGVSRKITTATDRKRLREIIEGLEVPDGMGLIVRTAGQQRTKADIRRDYEYLLRMWDNVRELTLQSSAPALVYEEASLIKRAIRDLYRSDVDDVFVEGEEGYKQAKSIMKMLMPSHAKRVQRYEERIPLFHRHQVEQQLDLMHSPRVQLRSGGYIVINSTEALVAIDVNSGRATRERNIEETATKTNLEAAEEVARQLRLRDLAGLIVIDFIDMEEGRNNRAVERKLKDCLKGDRARIQVGRISAFGLLELSRQRLRPSLLETSTETCAACGGTGLVRSTESAALHVLRVIEDEGIKGSAQLIVHVPPQVGMYLLNQKRNALVDLERRFGLLIQILHDHTLIPPAHRVLREARAIPVEPIVPLPALAAPSTLASLDDDDEDEDEEVVEETIESESEPSEERAEVVAADDDGEQPSGRPENREPRGEGDERGGKRRRRGKRGGRRRRRREDGVQAGEGQTDNNRGDVQGDNAGEPAGDSGFRPLHLEIGRELDGAPGDDSDMEAADDAVDDAVNGNVGDQPPREGQQGERTGRRRRRRRGRRRGTGEGQGTPALNGNGNGNGNGEGTHAPFESHAEPAPYSPPTYAPEPSYAPAPQQETRYERAPEPAAPPAPPAPAPVQQPVMELAPAPEPEDPNKPRRKGWWSFGRG